MNKKVKYWRISLFSAESTTPFNCSGVSGLIYMPDSRPFFTGYSTSKPVLTGSHEFLELRTSETGSETRHIRMDQIVSVDCTPVYATEEKMESFAAAAAPLAKWLRENGNPHSTAMVTQVRADLMSDEIGVPLVDEKKQ